MSSGIKECLLKRDSPILENILPAAKGDNRVKNFVIAEETEVSRYAGNFEKCMGKVHSPPREPIMLCFVQGFYARDDSTKSRRSKR